MTKCWAALCRSRLQRFVLKSDAARCCERAGDLSGTGFGRRFAPPHASRQGRRVANARQQVCPQARSLCAAQPGELPRPQRGPSMGEARSALLVSAVEQDHDFLGRIFFQHGWMLYRTGAIESALVSLRDHPVPVVITERNFPLGNWKDLLAATRHLNQAPLLIVTDRLADEYLWAEVLNLGRHGVLCQPFQVTELLWVLGTAWRTGGGTPIAPAFEFRSLAQ